MPDIWLSAVFCPIKKIKITPPDSTPVFSILEALTNLRKLINVSAGPSVFFMSSPLSIAMSPTSTFRVKSLIVGKSLFYNHYLRKTEVVA